MKKQEKRQKNSLIEARRHTILLGVMILFILFLSGFTSALEFDNVKTYDSNTKTITIENSFGLGSDIAKVKLLTDIDNHVGAGYQKVAEFEVDSYSDYSEAIKTIELYNLKDNSKSIERNIDFKYKTIKNVEVPDYKLECIPVTDKNGTKYDSCEYKVIGSHIERQEVWEDLLSTNLKVEKLTIGLFTEVQVGDKVEWIPNLFGVKIDEWATWTADLNTNLVAYYPFEEGTGTTSADVKGGYNLVGTNTPHWTTSGKIGNATNISLGDSEFWYNSSGDLMLNGSVSVNAWITVNSANGNAVAISKGMDTASGGNRYSIRVDAAGTKARSQTRFTGGTSQVDTTSTMSTGNWYMITYVKNTTGILVYYNGVLEGYVANANAYATPVENDNFMIGGMYESGAENYFWDGAIDEVGVWNRELTAAEVTQLYNSGTGITYSKGINVTLISPIDEVILLNQTVDFQCFATHSLPLVNVSLYVDGIKNQTNTSGINNTFYNFTTILGLGSHNWTCEALDNADTLYKATERNFDINVFNTNSETYSNSTTEGNSETFKINLTTATGYQISSAKLFYNGTGYTGILDNTNAPTYIITKNLIIPDVATATNISFNWNVTLTNGDTAVSTAHNQSVAAFTLDNCTTNTVLLYNFTLKDEGTQDTMNGTLQNSSIEAEIIIYSLDRSVSLIHVFANYSKIYFAPICLSNNLTNEKYSLDGIIKYSAGDYATEYYNIQNSTLTNSTKNQTIFLYDLLSADNQPFRITYKDSSYLPVSEALINIQRKYVSEGSFKTVEIPKTDSSGETVGNLELNDVIYNFVVTKNGFTLGVFNNVRVVCQTPAISECKVDLNSFSSSIPITNYTLKNNFYGTLTHDKTTRVTTATFTVLDGTVSTIKLNVTKEDSIGTRVCSESITTSSGTLTCTSPASIGNGTITAYLYKDGVLVGSKSFYLGKSPSDLYPGFAVFLGIFVLLTLMGAGISDNPVYTLIFFLLGIVVLFVLNIVAGGIGIGATILWFIVAIVLVIIKLVKRR